MTRFIPILALPLLVVGCESRAEKIKRVFSAWVASADASVFNKNLYTEIYKLSGGAEEDLQAYQFCRPYLWR